jgi:hypothetical protein
MWRTLRAFAWMRWRVLMNTLERTGARDTVERLSLAIEQIGPIIALALLAPSALGLAALSAYAGYWLPGPDDVGTFRVIGFLLFIACGLCLVGPLLMPSMDRANAVRLLLLPISPRTLYVAQSASALSDPWTLLAVTIAIGVPVGLVAAGAIVAAAVAVLAGALLVLVLAGLSTLSAFVLHLIVRDRRRGELVTLIVIVILPLIGLFPGLLNGHVPGERRYEERRARVERLARGEKTVMERVIAIGRRAYPLLPPELYAGAVRASARRDPAAAVGPLVGLGASAAILHALGLLTFRRLLDSPDASSRRQAARLTGAWRARIPGVSRAAMAVAQAQLRLTLRTPRGRSMLLSPLLVFALFAILLRRNLEGVDFGVISVVSGLGLATLGAAGCLLSVLPFAMNQFAIDRAGLTLALLSPLDHRALLVGKAVGNGVVIAASALLCMLVAYTFFPSGDLALWISIPLALAATYILAAPGAAALSALFPRAVDLNSIGRGSNAHGAAGLIGLLMFVAAGAPTVLLTLVATAILRRPALAPLLLLAWCVVVLIVSRVLFRAAAALFDKRRENLAMVAT